MHLAYFIVPQLLSALPNLELASSLALHRSGLPATNTDRLPSIMLKSKVFLPTRSGMSFACRCACEFDSSSVAFLQTQSGHGSLTYLT